MGMKAGEGARPRLTGENGGIKVGDLNTKSGCAPLPPKRKEKLMNRRTFVKALPAAAVLAGTACSLAQQSATSAPQGLEPIVLPKPEKDGGKSVLSAQDPELTVSE